jgi:hypothetical protein
LDMVNDVDEGGKGASKNTWSEHEGLFSLFFC